MVKQRANRGREKVAVVTYPPRRSLFQVLMDREQLAERNRTFSNPARFPD